MTFRFTVQSQSWNFTHKLPADGEYELHVAIVTSEYQKLY